MIINNFSLKNYNTFGIDVLADQLAVIKNEKMLIDLVKSHAAEQPYLILGGGSNMLFTRNPAFFILKNEIYGKRFEYLNVKEVLVTAGAGENWHDFVCWCLSHDFGGIENLSLIPGTVGAAPIQNIGAYGVEIKDVFVELSAIELATGNKVVFAKDECQFGYRDSIFKRSLKGQFCITEVSFKLTRDQHSIKKEYGAIKSVLETKGIVEPRISDIHEAVMEIRQSKLPDPQQLGNAGSFFKNPEIPKIHFLSIQKDHPEIPSYPGSNGLVKVPAGWLIEKCGWKGKKVGETGCYPKQALIIVNYGKATGEEIKNLSERIQSSVAEKFNIHLQSEVNII